MSQEEFLAAARTVASLFSGQPLKARGKTSRQERLEQAERIRQFLTLPIPLQEGCLKYAQNILDAYRNLSL
jgi:hypothetical protein